MDYAAQGWHAVHDSAKLLAQGFKVGHVGLRDADHRTQFSHVFNLRGGFG